MSHSFSRRQMIKSGVLAAIGSTITSNNSSAASSNNISRISTDKDSWQEFKIGIASYTFRKLSLDDTIKSLQRLNLSYISIKDFHLALTSNKEERQLAVQKMKAAGITPLSCGNVTMENDEANCRTAFEYARDIGVPVIVCNPHPDSFPILDKLVKEFDLKLAIHNHGPEADHFRSPDDAMKLAEKFDERIGVCVDVGHTA